LEKGWVVVVEKGKGKGREGREEKEKKRIGSAGLTE
jgi:hypothetical protein